MWWPAALSRVLQASSADFPLPPPLRSALRTQLNTSGHHTSFKLACGGVEQSVWVWVRRQAPRGVAERLSRSLPESPCPRRLRGVEGQSLALPQIFGVESKSNGPVWRHDAGTEIPERGASAIAGGRADRAILEERVVSDEHPARAGPHRAAAVE